MSPNKQPSRTETIQQMANQSEAYRNFIDSINSEAFRYEYAKNIRYFLDFTGAGDYDSLLEIDQQQIETKIRDYIVYLRQTKRSGNQRQRVLRQNCLKRIEKCRP